jgi:hypothetical protein
LLAGTLAPIVGAEAPDYVASSPIYLLTSIDRRQVQKWVNWYFEDSEDAFDEISRKYRRLLRGFHGIGMIDVAPYVYVQKVLELPYVFSYHLHAVVWGMTEDEIQARCAEVRGRVKALLPISSAVKCTEFEPEDFLQLCWYVAKMPRNQYQLWARETRGWRQFKSAIFPLNAVRTYSNQWGLTLDGLTTASGEGCAVLEKMLAEVRSWRRRAGWEPCSLTDQRLIYPPFRVKGFPDGREPGWSPERKKPPRKRS